MRKELHAHMPASNLFCLNGPLSTEWFPLMMTLFLNFSPWDSSQLGNFTSSGKDSCSSVWVCWDNVKNLCQLTHRTQLTGLSGRMGLFKQIHLFHSDRSVRILNNDNAVSSLFPYHMAGDAADHMLHLLTTKEDCWIRLFHLFQLPFSASYFFSLSQRSVPGNVKEGFGGGTRGRWGVSNGCQWAESKATEGRPGEVEGVCVGGRGGFRLKPDD